MSTNLMDNIEDYNHVFLLIYLHNLVEQINKISNVFVFQDHILSNMDSILTIMKEYMHQNKVEFDMNDILFQVYIDVNQQEYLMDNVLVIEHLFHVYYHNDLDMNSKVTKKDKDIFLRFKFNYL